jgi:uncharacterized protein YpuA (DUF1002 family)
LPVAFVGAVVAAAIVMVGRLDAATGEMDVVELGPCVVETDAVEGLAALRLPLDAVEGMSVAASTTDGLTGDGACTVSYGLTLGTGTGADVGV